MSHRSDDSVRLNDRFVVCATKCSEGFADGWGGIVPKTDATGIKMGRARLSPGQQRLVRRAPTAFGAVAIALGTVWVLFFATGSAGSAVDEPGKFVVALLNSVTLAGLFFVVASGFTLIFGLMRTVNMAHGALFVLAAYIGIEIQRAMLDATSAPDPNEVGLAEWFVPLLAAASVVAVLGVIIQQVFLRWNQGNELQQALITIAIAVIVADQVLREFGGLAENMVFPGAVTEFFGTDSLPSVVGERYPTSRLFMLGVALVVGAALWVWLNRTRMGMVIRAGVDDRDMVRALGINITVIFAITFFVGSFLAGMGGVMGASFSGVSPDAGGVWLLNSLVVVIIGGLGSIKGAFAGSLLYGTVVAFSPSYMPPGWTQYSILATFVLLALVLAARPSGLFGQAE
jgi:branched-chain amino acid transport system permease protein